LFVFLVKALYFTLVWLTTKKNSWHTW
jgi:hypothetical protein